MMILFAALLLSHLFSAITGDCFINKTEIRKRAHTSGHAMRVYNALKMPCDGWVTLWEYYADIAGGFYASAWQLNNTNKFNKIGYNKVIVKSAGRHVYRVPQEDQFRVATTNMLGLFHQDSVSGLAACLSFDKAINWSPTLSWIYTAAVHYNDAISQDLVTLDGEETYRYRMPSLRPYIEKDKRFASSVISSYKDCKGTDQSLLQVPDILDNDVSTCHVLPNDIGAIRIHLYATIRATTFVTLALNSSTCFPPTGITVFLKACDVNDNCKTDESSMCHLQAPSDDKLCTYHCVWQHSIPANALLIHLNMHDSLQLCEVML